MNATTQKTCETCKGEIKSREPYHSLRVDGTVTYYFHIDGCHVANAVYRVAWQHNQAFYKMLAITEAMAE